MSLIAKAAKLVEILAGERLCRVMGHNMGVAPPVRIGGRGRPAEKQCCVCGLTEPWASVPTPDHPETMTSGVTPEQAAGLARIDPGYAQGAS